MSNSTLGAGTEYERWRRVFRRLHELAENDRLRGMSAEELEGVLETEAESAASEGATGAER